MPEFSAAGEQAIADVAQRHDFSPDAVASMLRAVRAGHGRMAQFRHAEFGGSGQWMRGGMTMIGDMFDSALKTRVERLCDELSRLIAADSATVEAARATAPGEPVSLFVDQPPEQRAWWPPELGQPNSAGAQNGLRYAYFAAQRRLAIDAGDRVVLYDTLDHRIGGVAQQQSGSKSLTFTSQHGVVEVAALPKVSEDAQRRSAADPASDSKAQCAHDVVGTIEKLAALRDRGVLTEAEFLAKKTELLARL